MFIWCEGGSIEISEGALDDEAGVEGTGNDEDAVVDMAAIDSDRGLTNFGEFKRLKRSDYSTVERERLKYSKECPETNPNRWLE